MAADDGLVSRALRWDAEKSAPACGKARVVCCPGRERWVMSLWFKPTRFSLREGSVMWLTSEVL